MKIGAPDNAVRSLVKNAMLRKQLRIAGRPVGHKENL